MHPRFIELTGEVKIVKPNWVISKIEQALNDRCKAINGSRILIIASPTKKTLKIRENHVSWIFMPPSKSEVQLFAAITPTYLIYP